MGNNKSSSAHGSRPSRPPESIRREGRPADGAPRPSRPTSEPVAPAVDHVYQTPDPNFSLRVRDRGSSLISGRYHGNQLSVSNPNLSSPDGAVNNYMSGIDLSYLPRGLPQAVRPEEVSVYRRTVNQVTTIWPEYNAIREIDFETLQPGIRNTLQQILKRLSEQHESIKEQHEYRREVVELREERKASKQQLHRRDNELRGLREELQILRTELLNRGGQNINSPRVQSPRPSGSDDGRGAYLRDQQVVSMDMSDETLEDDALGKLKRKEKGGIFKATPLLQAEGTQDQLRRAVTRNQSLKPVAGEAHYAGNRPGSPVESGHSGGLDSSQAHVQQLEASLEKQRRENEILKNRLQLATSESTRPVGLTSLIPKRVIAMSEYRENYHQLEAAAMGKMKKTLSNQLSHTNKKRQLQFVCAVIQKSYDVSLRTVSQFKDMLRALLYNPVNVNAAMTASINKDRNRGMLANHIQSLENFKPGQGINNNISKLAKRQVSGEDIPQLLANQIYDYMESISDVIDITDLVQNVVDELRNEYGDCTTPALLNQASFNGFMRDCCRLCWQMCVPEKQLYVCSRDHWRFEERYHVTDSSRGTINARIDYYLWPILFSRMNEGEVLYKGRVSLKL